MGRERAMRAHALAALARGVIEEHPDTRFTQTAPCSELRAADLIIAYRTPFQRVAAAPQDIKYFAAQRGSGPVDFGYNIDVWAPKKVLSVGWNSNGSTRVMSFKPGDWEQKLEALAAERKTRATR